MAKRFPDLVVPPFMLALWLLLHDARGENSPYEPLIRSLPTEAELSGMPIFMPPKALRELQGTDAATLADELQEELQQTYRDYVKPIAKAKA